jgi:hypothetical protein
LQRVVDALASEYGWTRDQVLELYPGEVKVFMCIISGRKATETLTRLACADWPHLKKRARNCIHRELREAESEARVYPTLRSSPEVEARKRTIRSRVEGRKSRG